MALLRRDADDDAVARDARAAGDGAAIAAALADDRRGFAGDGGFVDRRDALDDLAVGGNQIARRANDEVADLQLAAGNRHFAAVDQLAGGGLGAHFAQLVGMRLAAALGHRFGEVGEKAGEPKPETDLEVERVELAGQEKEDRGRDRSEPDDEHHEVFDFVARVQLLERVQHRLADQGGIFDFEGGAHGRKIWLVVRTRGRPP
jgi:hypothetical protein